LVSSYEKVNADRIYLLTPYGMCILYIHVTAFFIIFGKCAFSGHLWGRGSF